jgi:hypothetical protein
MVLDAEGRVLTRRALAMKVAIGIEAAQVVLGRYLSSFTGYGVVTCSGGVVLSQTVLWIFLTDTSVVTRHNIPERTALDKPLDREAVSIYCLI